MHFYPTLNNNCLKVWLSRFLPTMSVTDIVGGRGEGRGVTEVVVGVRQGMLMSVSLTPSQHRGGS